MNVGSWAKLILVLWLAVVDNQCHCPYIDTTANRFGTKQDLNLLVPQFRNPYGFRCGAVLGMYVIFITYSANSSAFSMYIVDIDIIFSSI
jgi:hypothetical protein